MLRRYERLLEQRHLADPAAVLRLALTSMEHEGHRMPDTLGPDVVVLVPGVSTRRLNGQLLSALQARGAKVLETDPVVGLDVPDSILWNRHSDTSAFSYRFAPDRRPCGSPSRPSRSPSSALHCALTAPTACALARRNSRWGRETQ